MHLHDTVGLMQTLGLLDWPSLWVGLERGWVWADDLIAFSTQWLLEHPDEDNEHITLLAGGESLDEAELRDMLGNHLREVSGETPDPRAAPEVDKWRLAALCLLDQSDLPPDEKLDALEELRAEFDYPEDMRACSRYYVPPQFAGRQFAVGEHLPWEDPFEAVQAVIAKLRKQFGVS